MTELAVFDTNILIDFLNGRPEAKRELALYDEPQISAVTWMEVLVGTHSREEPVICDFLLGFRVLPVDKAVGEYAVRIRRESRLRLPDAIIWATARCLSSILVTRNTRDFPSDHPGIRIPYQL